MGADDAHIRRMKLFGMALCFLAALFFVEAKTAWASGDQFTPTEIAAVKVCDADRIPIVAFSDVQEAAPVRCAPAASWPGICLHVTGPDVKVLYRALTKPVSREIYRGEIPFALTNLPPPFNS